MPSASMGSELSRIPAVSLRTTGYPPKSNDTCKTYPARNKRVKCSNNFAVEHLNHVPSCSRDAANDGGRSFCDDVQQTAFPCVWRSNDCNSAQIHVRKKYKRQKVFANGKYWMPSRTISPRRPSCNWRWICSTSDRMLREKHHQCR
jgi:hypothetical protein